jgi:PST family polysaccharide transporter
MEEFDPQLVAKRSIRGVFAFVSRSFVISAVNFGRDIILAALLSASIYGMYFIVEQLMTVVSYFSDVGLAGALIQKKEAVTQEDLQTTFTAQTVLVLIIVSILFIFSSSIGSYSHLPQEGIWLLQAFIVAFFVSSLKTIPSVIMERNLEFGKFVIPQVVETLFYTVTVIVFAWKGYGITSFTYAVLARAFSGLITMYIVCPWKVRIQFSKQSFSHLLSFGIPFQMNNILALIKDNLIFVLYLSRVLPIEQLGYIGFSMKWAFLPLRQVMDNVIRVTFSSFSRLQHDRQALGKAFEKSLTAGTILIYPALIGLVIIIPYVTALIPKYHKWEPAIFSLMLFAANALLAAVLVPLTNLLNAIGKIKITLYFMVIWTVLTWILTPVAIQFMGFNGFALVTAVINISVIPIIILSKKYVDFDTIKAIRYPVIATIVMGIVLYFTSVYLVKDIPTLIIDIVIGAMIYFGVLFLIAKNELIADIQFIKDNLKK